MSMGGGLVGREAQVEALQEFLEGAPAGRPPVTLVAGEAGVGKTALVDHVLAGAGQPIRRGWAAGRKSAVYEVLAQVLTPAAGQPTGPAGPGALALPARPEAPGDKRALVPPARLDGPGRELALVLPGFGPPPAQVSQSALAGQSALAAAVAAVLVRMAGPDRLLPQRRAAARSSPAGGPGGAAPVAPAGGNRPRPAPRPVRHYHPRRAARRRAGTGAGERGGGPRGRDPVRGRGARGRPAAGRAPGLPGGSGRAGRDRPCRDTRGDPGGGAAPGGAAGPGCGTGARRRRRGRQRVRRGPRAGGGGRPGVAGTARVLRPRVG